MVAVELDQGVQPDTYSWYPWEEPTRKTVRRIREKIGFALVARKEGLTGIVEKIHKYRIENGLDGVFYLHIAKRKLLIVNEAPLIEFIMGDIQLFNKPSNSFNKYINKMFEGLINAPYDVWKIQSPAAKMSGKDMEGYQGIMHDLCVAVIERIKQNPGEYQLEEVFGTLTQDVLVETLFNVDAAQRPISAAELQELLGTITNAVKLSFGEYTTGKLSNVVMLKNKIKFWFDHRKVARLLERAVKKYIEHIDKQGITKGWDIISRLIFYFRSQGIEGFRHIASNIAAFQLAGYLTVRGVMASLIDLLSKHPDQWEMVEKDVLEAADSSFDTVRSGLKVLGAAIGETMRIRPVIELKRTETSEDTLLGKYFVPKNTVILSFQKVMHNDSRFWKDPEKYDITRFMEKESYPLGWYFPFGGKRRICWGNSFADYEMKTILSLFIRHLNIRVVKSVLVNIDTLTLPQLTVHLSPRKELRAA